MSEKHNGSIFATFDASLVVLSIASLKLCFTKLPLAAMFLKSILPKGNRLPSRNNINDCTKFEDNR